MRSYFGFRVALRVARAERVCDRVCLTDRDRVGARDDVVVIVAEWVEERVDERVTVRRCVGEYVAVGAREYVSAGVLVARAAAGVDVDEACDDAVSRAEPVAVVEGEGDCVGDVDGGGDGVAVGSGVRVGEGVKYEAMPRPWYVTFPAIAPPPAASQEAYTLARTPPENAWFGTTCVTFASMMHAAKEPPSVTCIELNE